MLTCFTLEPTAEMVPIIVVPQMNYPAWLTQQDEQTQRWLATTSFRAEPTCTSIIPGSTGKIAKVICCVSELANFWQVGHLSMLLPEGAYRFETAEGDYLRYALAWGLGAYQFLRYKKPVRNPAQLLVPAQKQQRLMNTLESIYQVRNWINTPTDDMGPTEFAEVAHETAKQYKAKIQETVGTALLKNNYNAIYTVGRASDDPPRLLDMRWGNAKDPKVTLVGKGVCFDSGGLDLKSSAHMLLMKKDMAGAAHVLGLASMIMHAKLPVSLRVLMPVVENVISGNAYRPGDVIKSRKGLTVEVGNTDAEGRLILADALAEAVTESPDLLIDIATLTGAARVALGTDLPAMFCNQDDLAVALIQSGAQELDPLWRLPLFTPYREYLNSTIADINNHSAEPYGGAITAALFLKEFVPDHIPWVHFDLMAWNLRPKPGRPQGGEAMVLRALFNYLEAKFG